MHDFAALQIGHETDILLHTDPADGVRCTDVVALTDFKISKGFVMVLLRYV